MCVQVLRAVAPEVVMRAMALMVALGGLLAGACAAPAELESVEDQDEAWAVEEPATRGSCDDAVNDGADIWRLMCGAMLVDAFTKRQCMEEQMHGRGKGVAACRTESCENSCVVLDDRWSLYCDERAPVDYRSICNQARQRGYDVCINVCEGRSLDADHGGASRGSCSQLLSESSI
jgi:hypothetical protein